MIDFLAAAVRIATPLLLAALGGILSERAGVFAVGLEGMMLMGAFTAVVGAWASDSSFIGVVLALVGGAPSASSSASSPSDIGPTIWSPASPPISWRSV
jgi:general nucleoside transport system permease protein